MTGSGRLFALEIDTEGAAAEFKAIINSFVEMEQVHMMCMCCDDSILITHVPDLHH